MAGELWDISQRELLLLESLHRNILCTILGSATLFVIFHYITANLMSECFRRKLNCYFYSVACVTYINEYYMSVKSAVICVHTK